MMSNAVALMLSLPWLLYQIPFINTQGEQYKLCYTYKILYYYMTGRQSVQRCSIGPTEGGGTIPKLKQNFFILPDPRNCKNNRFIIHDSSCHNEKK